MALGPQVKAIRYEDKRKGKSLSSSRIPATYMDRQSASNLLSSLETMNMAPLIYADLPTTLISESNSPSQAPGTPANSPFA